MHIRSASSAACRGPRPGRRLPGSIPRSSPPLMSFSVPRSSGHDQRSYGRGRVGRVYLNARSCLKVVDRFRSAIPRSLSDTASIDDF